jgi:hypothetical protein
MISVVFVGDEPSKSTYASDIPFVGAKCFKTLVCWINNLSPDYYICFNSREWDDREKAKFLHAKGFKVVALGKMASKRLPDTPHFCLPHPSGLNRQLNDKEFVADRLQECYNYIRSKSNE